MGTYKLKILVLGNSFAGKTAIVNKFVKGFHSGFNIPPITIGCDIFSIDVLLNGHEVSLFIFDIGGLERFKPFRSTFYRGAAAAIIVFDLTRYTTFNPHIVNWIKELWQLTGRIPVVVIGNKVDLVNMRAVRSSDAKQFCDQVPCPFFETSAKTGVNIDMTFYTLTEVMLNSILKKSAERKKILPKLIKKSDKEFESFIQYSAISSIETQALHILSKCERKVESLSKELFLKILQESHPINLKKTFPDLTNEYVYSSEITEFERTIYNQKARYRALQSRDVDFSSQIKSVQNNFYKSIKPLREDFDNKVYDNFFSRIEMNFNKKLSLISVFFNMYLLLLLIFIHSYKGANDIFTPYDLFKEIYGRYKSKLDDLNQRFEKFSKYNDSIPNLDSQINEIKEKLTIFTKKLQEGEYKIKDKISQLITRWVGDRENDSDIKELSQEIQKLQDYLLIHHQSSLQHDEDFKRHDERLILVQFSIEEIIGLIHELNERDIMLEKLLSEWNEKKDELKEIYVTPDKTLENVPNLQDNIRRLEQRIKIINYSIIESNKRIETRIQILQENHYDFYEKFEQILKNTESNWNKVKNSYKKYKNKEISFWELTKRGGKGFIKNMPKILTNLSSHLRK